MHLISIISVRRDIDINEHDLEIEFKLKIEFCIHKTCIVDSSKATI